MDLRSILVSYANGIFLKAADWVYKANSLFEDADYREANNFDVHKDTAHTDDVASTSRRYNEGVGKGVNPKTQIIAPIAIEENHLVIDNDMKAMIPDSEQFLREESSFYVKGVANATARKFWYGNKAIDGQVGIANIFGTKQKTHVNNQIFDAGGIVSDGLTSIYAIGWSPMDTFMIYPKGSAGGIRIWKFVSDMINDGTGKSYQGTAIGHSMRNAPFVKNFRSVYRVANISTQDADLATLRTTIFTLLSQIATYIQDSGVLGNICIYMNRTMMKVIRDARDDKTRYIPGLSESEIGGKKYLTYEGLPLKVNDFITNAEAQVQ